MEFLNNHLNNMARTPKEYYHDFNQAVINDRWDDTTQLYSVKEQTVDLESDYIFTDDYTEFDAWVDMVSDQMVQVAKVYSDFIEVMPQDIDHSQNYRGQYYKLALDGEHEETYLCYDRINRLTNFANFKCVRCNNQLVFRNANNEIVSYPCYLGTDISSTNDYVSKSGIIPNSRMIIWVQNNQDTQNITNNQRFMFEGNSCYEVEERNMYIQDQGTNGKVTLIRLYVKYSPLRSVDNTELRLCDYYDKEDKPVIYSTEKYMEVSPRLKDIRLNKSQVYTCTVKDENGFELSQDITYTVDWSDDNYYTIEQDGNKFTVTCKNIATKPLNITFSSQGCEDVVATARLIGVI